MAAVITDPSRVQSWVKAKQTNEQEMLKRLNRAFNKPEAYEKIRKVVMSALLQMKLEANLNPAPAKNAVSAEAALAVWQKIPTGEAHPLNRLGNMLAELCCYPNKFDINDLSELIRVIGAWLENGGGHAGIPKELTEAFRPGIRTKGMTQEAVKKLIWDKGTVRQREDRIKDEALYHEIEEHVRRAWVRPKFGRASGLQMFRVNRNDLCKKIDLLFGLLKGATISGTTTDTVLVLEAFGFEHNLHAGYYLFPVATIAASLHHTLVEAGLALTLVEAIESYRVGFYTTLKPKEGLPGELQDVDNILRSAEQDMRNRHFVLWYEGNENPAGCVLWDKLSEVEASKRLVESKGLLTHVRSLPEFPTKMDVARFINLMQPRLLAYLPQEFQPNRLRMH